MEEIEEAVFNGFCKILNETRSVFCEFEVQDGRLCLAEADCDYGACPHTETCVLMKQAGDLMEEYNQK